MAYAKKTCYKCGMIKPVNYMEQRVVQTSSGKTQDELTFGTWLGFWFFISVSKRRVKKRFFANNRRGHKRKTPRWICARNMCNITTDGERMSGGVKVSREGFGSRMEDNIRGFFWQMFLVVTSFAIALVGWGIALIVFLFLFYGGI